MTVTWRLTQDDIKNAIKEWLRSQHSVDAEGASITFTNYVSEGTIAEVKGTVDTYSTGPYR